MWFLVGRLVDDLPMVLLLILEVRVQNYLITSVTKQNSKLSWAITIPNN
jgi:hypothetical protein